MIKEIRINDIKDVFNYFCKVEKDPTINRYRSAYVYRGLPNVKYKLITSLERNCGNNQYRLEKCILRNFTKYASIIDKQNLSESEWNQLIIGQHHGLPTRMLDWTYSSLVGLNFALTERTKEDFITHDCVVWAINVEEIIGLLPTKYKKILKEQEAYVFTTDMLRSITLEEYDSDMMDRSFVILEPPSIDERIVNQYSYFSVVPSGIKDFEDFLDTYTTETFKYIISKDIRWQIREILDTMNVNERILFPGYDGICKWLKRHYSK